METIGFEETIHELFKTVQYTMSSATTDISETLKELEWKIICCNRMNQQLPSTPSMDLRLRQLIPIDFHDLNATLHS